VIFDDKASILLSSPVALYDRPEIHSQSSGDLFDGTEMEEALILHLQVLTEKEKNELKGDDKLISMLSRMETVSPEHLYTIHDFLKENNFSGL
jgi:hydrogenase maturation protease